MKRTRLIIASMVYSFIIIIFALVYIMCKNVITDKRIYNISEKKYVEIGKKLSVLLEDKWKILDIIKRNIDSNNSNLNMKTLRAEQKNTSFEDGSGYFNVIFINEYGEYISIDGKKGRLNNGMIINKRMNDRFITDGNIIADSDMVMFGRYVVPSVLGDFKYNTIAIVYSLEYMENLLNIYDSGSWFITETNGNILYKHNGRNYNIDNIIAYYEDTIKLDYEQLTTIKEKLAGCENGTVSYSNGTETFYLTYVYNEGDDWCLVGAAPRSAYSVTEYYITVLIATGIFIMLYIIIICVISMVINEKGYNILILDKSGKNRDLIFNILQKGYEDMFIIISEDCCSIEYVSRNMQEVFGINCDEAVKNDVALLVTNDGKSLLDINMLKSIRQGEERKIEDEYYNIVDRQNHWYLKTMYHDEEELGGKYLVVFSDRTNEYEKDMHIQQALDIARNANMSKDKFMSSLSHDMRTPVNAISGMAALIAKEADDKHKVIEYAEKISEACQHLQGLVNEILDISKIESGKPCLNTTKFSMAKLLQEISQVIRVQARNKEQMFIIETKNLCHNIFVGDKMRISQIIINLLSNAVKYTHVGGNIRLCIQEERIKSVTKCASKLIFIVSDNGSGMSREYQSVLFEPFSRENSISVAGVQGTGLGMSITKALVQLMGGSIDVSSCIGKGSEFTVTIYLETDESYKHKKSAPAAGDEGLCPSGAAGKRALVAEDYSINAKIMTEILKMDGITADIVADGREALKMFELSPEGFYDIIFMDIHMPFMDGYEATRRIRSLDRSDTKSIPIVAMSAGAFEKEFAMAKNAGMDEYITKPINIKDFRKKVCKLLKKMEGIKEINI